MPPRQHFPCSVVLACRETENVNELRARSWTRSQITLPIKIKKSKRKESKRSYKLCSEAWVYHSQLGLLCTALSVATWEFG